MPKILFLFPDTNVLEQCRALVDLDWTAVSGDAEEIHLIVTRPVQTEIDNHKSRGHERLAKRARKASSALRDLIVGGKDHLLIRQGAPVVKLFIQPTLRPSPALANILDYSSRPDDQLVGIVRAFIEENSDTNARVLTHDTGPMATAQAVGVPFTPVPDDWLLPPESTGEDKRIRALEAEVAKLTEVEPDFDVMCIDAATGEAANKLELELVRYDTLNPTEVADFLRRLKERFPVATNFGPREREERVHPGGLANFLQIKQVFEPVTDKEIADYRAAYEDWLDKCQTILRSLHTALQRIESPLCLVFMALNRGRRPANDTLLTFRAHGRFKIMPPPYRSKANTEETQGEQLERVRALPTPPLPPAGQWKTQIQNNPHGALAALAGLAHRNIASPHQFHPSSPDFRIPDLGPIKRDPNAFYYKQRPTVAVEEFSLECKQWRHGVGPEGFDVQIHIDKEGIAKGEVSGAIECRIHAENLSSSVVKTLPVAVRVRHQKVLDIAAEMVALCGLQRASPNSNNGIA